MEEEMKITEKVKRTKRTERNENKGYTRKQRNTEKKEKWKVELQERIATRKK